MYLGIWYIYYSNPDINWRQDVVNGLAIAFPRLESYFGGTWDFEIIDEFHTSVQYDYHIMPTKCIEAIQEMNSYNPNFKNDYNRTQVPIFIFANSRDAFLINYKSPIYSSLQTFIEEYGGVKVLVEHEFSHSLGCPDHMKPFANPKYNNCIMGNPYLGQILYCSECKPKAILSNYKKESYSNLMGLPVEIEPKPIIPQEKPIEPTLPTPSYPNTGGIPNLALGGISHAYWAGLDTPQQITSYNNWPSERDIYIRFQIKSFPESTVVARVVLVFYGPSIYFTTGTLQIVPGETKIVTFIIEPLPVGTYSFSLKLIVDDNEIRIETMTANVYQSEAPIIPVYRYDREEEGAFPWIPVALIAGGIIVAGSAMLPKGKA